MTNFEIGIAIIVLTLIALVMLLSLYIKECEKEKIQAYNKPQSKAQASTGAASKPRIASKSRIFNENFEKVLLKSAEESKFCELSLQNAVRLNGDDFKITNFARIVYELLEIAIEKKLITASRFDLVELSEEEVTYAVFAISLMAATTKVNSMASIRINSHVKTNSSTPYTLAIVQRIFLLMASPLYDNVMRGNLKGVVDKKKVFDGLMNQSYNNVYGMTV
ncbi:hypothetical protein LMH73_027695 [Vibrio splendidus]|nr:hypothetical protein [Vibrio splendidus]MCC4882462.1 hypothetical protein [Vibrio splendidus]